MQVQMDKVSVRHGANLPCAIRRAQEKSGSEWHGLRFSETFLDAPRNGRRNCNWPAAVDLRKMPQPRNAVMNTDQRLGVAQPVAWLQLDTGEAEPALWGLKPGMNTVGRAADSSDIQVDHPTISERHCVIEVTPDGVTVQDLGSTNGTFVDGEPVQQAVLKSGQKLRFGEVELLFQEAMGAAEGTPSSLMPDPQSRVAQSNDETHCANHPQSRSTWICEDCGRRLCAACVKQVKLEGGRSVTVCQVCHGVCQRLGKSMATPRGSRRLIPGLVYALGYPFRGNGPFMLGGAALLQLVTSALGLLGALVSLAVGVYLMALMLKIVASASQGEETMPGWPDFDGDTLRDAFVQSFSLGLICFGPHTLCLTWLHPETPAAKLACEGLLAMGLIYFPMALLGVVIYDSLAGLNPLLVVLSIVKVPLRYATLCLFLGALFGINLLIEMTSRGLGVLMLASALSGVAGLYSMVVAMRAIGWFYYCVEERLAWS
jgi:pSer/pThr/pTyr-binding forkhead associated (FHA) protein